MSVELWNLIISGGELDHTHYRLHGRTVPEFEGMEIEFWNSDRCGWTRLDWTGGSWIIPTIACMDGQTFGSA